MTDNLRKRDQLGLLLNALTEGQLTADQRAQLNALLREDPALVPTYLDHLTLHSLLRAEHGVPQPIALSAAKPPRRVQGSRSSELGLRSVAPGRESTIRNPQFAIGLVIAAAIALALTAWFVSPPSTPHSALGTPQSAPIATVTDVRGDVVFASDPLTPGDEIAAQTIATSTGSVNLLLRSGTSVDLAGPARLQLVSPMSVSLQHGQARFDCPHSAAGFTVQMPDGSRVVDLGTRFEIDVAGPRAARVLVLEGSVELQLPGGGRFMLAAGRQASLVDGAVERVITHHVQPIVQLTAEADTYVRLGEPQDNYHNAHELVIKNAGSGATTRKGYLRFDAGEAHHFVHDAELKLQVRHNDSGDGSSVPNALHFAVYGLLETGGAAPPDVDAMTWPSAPASDPAGNGLDPARTVLLGTLAVPAADPRAEPIFVSLTSPALARFIRGDRDGVVTFILTRVEEDGRWNSSFHARESAAGLAPTLTLHNTAPLDPSTPDKEISR